MKKCGRLYQQYRSNNSKINNQVTAEDFDTIFNEYIPTRDDDTYNQRKNEKVKQALEGVHDTNQDPDLAYSEKIYLQYAKEDNSRLNNAQEVQKNKYFGAFEKQEERIGDKLDQVFDEAKKIDHQVNNVRCKNKQVANKLAPVITNMFIVYQREIIEEMINDLLEDEVFFVVGKKKFKVRVLNRLEEIKYESKQIIEEAVVKNQLKDQFNDKGFGEALDIILELENYKYDCCDD